MATTVISGSSSISNKTLTDVLVSGADAMLYVRSGGQVVSATTTINGTINLISGGKCEIASFLSGGQLFIYSGSASKVNIGSGGFLGIHGDGSKSNSVAIAYTTTISSGGTMFLNYAGAANGTTVLNGGQLSLGGYSSSFGSHGYNYAFDTTLSGGSMAIGYKARAEKNFIYSSGRLFVASGGTATTNYIKPGGSLIVDGSATSNYIDSGGYMGVESGGIASSNTVYADGSMNVWRGGKASSTEMFGGKLILEGESYSGTYRDGSVTIAPGGYSFKEVFSSGTFLVNGSTSNGSRAEGNVSSGTIGSGVTMNINGGRFVGTTVSSAIINVTTGYADLTNLSGAVATINGGTFYASSGGVMKSAVISGYGNGTSMGTMYVMSGATVNTVNVYESAHLGIMTGGSVTYASASVKWASDSASIGVSSGGRLDMAFVYGGMLDIGSGGSVTSAIFSSGGKGTVLGTLGCAIVSYDCSVQVSSGGAVSSAVISKARINVNGGTLGSAYVAFGAILSIDSNGSVGSATVSGSAQVNKAGKAAGLNIRSGGRLQVSGGPGSAVARDFRVSGMAQVCEGGSLLSGSVNSGGRIDVEYGGTAGSCTVSAGGMLRIYRGGMLHDISVLSGGKITGNYNCSDFTWSSGAVADMDITDFLPDNPSAFVTNLNYAKSKSVVFTLSVYASQTKGTYRLASGAAGFDGTITVQNYDGTKLGTLSVGEIVDIGGVNYRLDLGTDDVLSVTVGAAAPATAKGDVDGNGVSDVLFQYSGGDYQLGYWMNGTNEWRGQGLAKPAEWEVLGSYDMNNNGKADSVLVGNVEVGGVKGAYIGYYLDSVDADANWQNIGYLTNAEDIVWKNKVGNLTGNAGMNSIVWYAPEMYSLGAWTDGTTHWVSISEFFGGGAWKLVGCGDFDGDGKDSVVMSYGNGQLFYAVGIGGTPASLGSANWSGWEIRAIGDFAGDGKDDLVLFHNDTGAMVMCANGYVDSYESIGQLDKKDWFVVGAGDYNGDTRDDLLVRQYSTGMLGYYVSGDTSKWVELGRGVDMKWTVIA